MIVLPIQSEDHTKDAIIVVLDPPTVARLQTHDPAEIIVSQQVDFHLVNPTVVIAYEESTPTFVKLLNGHDLDAIVKYLYRGKKIQPEDHDRGWERFCESQ